MKNISIIGAGNMGSALAFGLENAGYSVKVSNRTPSKLERFNGHDGITVFTSNVMAIEDADMVIIAVHPGEIDGVIAEIGPCLNYNRTIVASLIPSKTLEDLYIGFQPYNKAPMIARVMPNTAVSVGESMTFVTLNEYAEAYAGELSTVFGAVGQVEIVKEKMFASAMVLCSCGLAYAFRYVRAASQGGVALGFDAEDACRYVCQTLRGAARMLEDSGMHPEAAVDTVTTAGGITIKGLVAMENAGFSPAVIAGLKLFDR